MKPYFYLVALFVALMSCSSSEQRQIHYVAPVEEHNSPIDSLLMEMEGLMQQYAAAESRIEQGENVEAHLRAIQAKMADFGLKMEMVMHEMNGEQIEQFNRRYNECLEHMGLLPSEDLQIVEPDTLRP